MVDSPERLRVVFAMKILLIASAILLTLAPATMIAVDDLAPEPEDIAGPEMAPCDDRPPVSKLASIPNVLIHPENCYCLPTIMLAWNGTDDMSGIAHYDVQYKREYMGRDIHTQELPQWQDLLVNTTDTSTEFYGQDDSLYHFRVRATDHWGNEEEWPVLWDSSTLVIYVPSDIGEEVQERLEEGAEWPTEDGERPEYPWYKGLDVTPPVSRMGPMAPLHLVINTPAVIQDDRAHIQVYPYPPSYLTLEELEEMGLISMTGLPMEMDISWNGTDEPWGTGVASYDVQYRQVEVDWTLVDTTQVRVPTLLRNWVTIEEGATETAGAARIDEEGLYQFRCRAVDNAGNQEEYPAAWDESVYVLDLRHYNIL